jgi:hypothetical protein
MHLRAETIGVVDDARRSHSSRPMHAVWFLRDVGLRDPAKNLPRWIFVTEILVDMPNRVSSGNVACL